MKSHREYWIDAVKVFACILVALGHFLQSMVKSSILPENMLFFIFNQSIYTFHVPLFFICSGYLYQKFSIVNSYASWKTNIQKKLISLGIPYVFFSIVTWGLKTIFSNHTNTAVGGLFESLVLSPIPPFWYLYCLFFLFVITPTLFNQKTTFLFLIAALAMKLISLNYSFNVYALSIVFTNEIWFVLGMITCKTGISQVFHQKQTIHIALSCLLFFFGCCIIITRTWTEYEQFFFGVIACIGIVLFAGFLLKNVAPSPLLRLLSKYTMPVFLMHTLFAASWRSLLLKIGISTPAIHLASGILITFIGPIIAAEIMEKIKWTDFFLHPLKYIALNSAPENTKNI